MRLAKEVYQIVEGLWDGGLKKGTFKNLETPEQKQARLAAFEKDLIKGRRHLTIPADLDKFLTAFHKKEK